MQFTFGLPSAPTPSSRPRSLGLKLFILTGLALAMSIPAFFVDGLVEERTQRQKDVVAEISSHVGGRQTFLGPVLSVPYVIPAKTRNDHDQHGLYLIFPHQATAQAQIPTEQRRRSLFEVTVFQAHLQMNSEFDLTGSPLGAPEGALLDWAHAELEVGVSDARGALSDSTISIDGASAAELEPASAGALPLAGANSPQLALFSVPAGLVARPGAHFRATALMHFSGAQRMEMLAWGKSTTFTAQGSWPSPSFDGGILPTDRAVTPQGFTAKWSVPYMARGIAAEGDQAALTDFQSSSMGISLVKVADPYQSVNRALKYLPLFLGLVFLSYFVFEVTGGRRLHPAQYVLVGVAQIIFYLLLLSIAEHIGFDWAYLVAGAASVGLLAANAAWVFASRTQGVRALAVFGLLYGFIYVLLRLEDDALLLGSVAAFAAVGAVMYCTRRIDWYGSPETTTSAPPADLAPLR